jgi:eukaryotic-like serine/threonine-protein kinase
LPHAPDLSGRALDERYELHALIGEGTFGRVYEGRDRRLDRPVAVKVIKPWWAEDPDWAATSEREARMLARVSDPGIVQIFDVGRAPEGVYYVSELVDGENLAARLQRGPLAPWEACGVAAQLCRALARAHAQRIVHRDVKPANILLSTEGRVKVGDFGVARLAEGSTEGNHAHPPPSIVGTPRYMAPEQGRGLPTTPATDIYSVGVVLYEMLAGRPPFHGETVVELALRHLQDPPPPLPAHVPGALMAITERALAKDPSGRYADGAEMAEALMQARRQSDAGRRARLTPARTRGGVRAPSRTAVGAGAGGAGRSEIGAPGRGGAGAPPPRRERPAGPGDHRDATQAAPVMSRRRNINPAARRRAAAALGVVVLVAVGMAAGAVLLAPPARTRVPRLTGLRRAAAVAAGRHAHVRVLLGNSYSARVPRGVALAQHPGVGALVDRGTAVRVVLSRGPAPVPVPAVVGDNVADAQRTLAGVGFHSSIHSVPAPGTAPGTVTA